MYLMSKERVLLPRVNVAFMRLSSSGYEVYVMGHVSFFDLSYSIVLQYRFESCFLLQKKARSFITKKAGFSLAEPVEATLQHVFFQKIAYAVFVVGLFGNKICECPSCFCKIVLGWLYVLEAKI